MARAYDLIVIGSGTAAQVASYQMASAGWKVAVVDHRPFGGTCALRGCDPKKMLLTGAQVMDDVARMSGRGVVAQDARISWRELMAFKRSFTRPIPAQQEQRYREKGIDTFHATARFTGPNAIEIDGTACQARHFLIATGARPVPLAFPGAEHLITNEEFLELDELPNRIVLVGGGYIAAEFSHIAAHAGAKVTVLQRRDRMLQHFDPDLVSWLMEGFQRAGIEVRTEHVVDAVEKTASGFLVRAHTPKKDERAFEADLVVHAAGRIPDVGRLNLGAGQIGLDEHGHLNLNEFLQSVSNPAVYAAGDAAAKGPPLTPVSSHDAKVVASNLLAGNHRRPDYRGVPSVAFTIPPIAKVGLGEDELRNNGSKFQIKSQKASDWFTAVRVNESVYGFKVMVEENTDRILGAHLVGPDAEEVINLFGLAIRQELTADALRTTIFSYPTGASDVGHML
jgi:glutathione reductase (NADPH)